jgi:hypothetical protein
MGIHYEWADERKIIMNIHIEFPWTWAEYKATMQVLMPLVRGVNHPVATAVDCSRLGAIPKDGNTLDILLNVEKGMPDNLFASAVVGGPYGVDVFMNMLTKLRPRAKRMTLFSKTLAEAHEKIYARHQELYPDLQPSR